MTMAVSVNSVAAILFLVSWALYLVAEASRTGGLAKPNCDNDDVKFREYLCNGYSAAAVWFVFGTVMSLVGAGLASRGGIRNILFVTSLALAALGYVCEFGGLTSAVNEAGSDAFGEEHDDLKTGYGAATVFFFFAFLSAIALIVTLAKFTEAVWSSILTFFIFLAFWSLALTGEFGGISKSNCDSDSSGDYGKAEDARCDGYGFAAFATAVAMVGSFWFAFLAFKSREDTNKIWVGWFIFAFITFVAYTSQFAANAQAFCRFETGDNNNKQCQGYSAAAFFVMLAALTALAGLVVACKEMANVAHTMFMATFSLFFLGYACFLGGQSAYNCAQDEDNADKGLGDLGFDDQCDGYGVATFFSICGFVITGIGAYFAYQGGDEVPHAQMEDQYPGDSSGMPPTTVGHTIDDDYNKA